MAGRGFRGAASGIRSLIDVLQYNDEQKLGAERTRKADEEKEHAKRLDAVMRAATLGEAGGYIEEPGVMGSPMFQSRLGPVGAARQRAVSPADLLSPEMVTGIRVDPMRSTRAKQQREKDAADLAARNATAKLFDTPEEQGAVVAGASPQDVRAARPPAAPRPGNIDPLSPEGIAAAIQRERGIASIPTRAQQSAGAGRGKTLPAAQIDKFAMLSDLETAARSLPALIDAQGGNVGTGPIAGRVPDFLKSGKGVNTRAVISSIEGQYLNLLSGAAVSPSEAARLEPFIPNQRDDEQRVKAKAVAFANRLRQILKAKRDAFRKAGYAVDEDGEGDSTDGDNAFADLIPPGRGG